MKKKNVYIKRLSLLMILLLLIGGGIYYLFKKYIFVDTVETSRIERTVVDSTKTSNTSILQDISLDNTLYDSDSLSTHYSDPHQSTQSDVSIEDKSLFNWVQLRCFVALDTFIPEQVEVLRIIDLPISSISKESQLRELSGGQSWKYIEDNFLRSLTSGSFGTSVPSKDESTLRSPTEEINPSEHSSDSQSLEQMLQVSEKDTLVEPEEYIDYRQEPLSKDSLATSSLGHDILSNDSLAGYTVYIQDSLFKDSLGTSALERDSLDNFNQSISKPLFAIKTNLLLDALTAVNLEIEYPIGQRWSIAAEGIFPWWLLKEKQYCLQLLSFNLEGRYWFGNRLERPVLTGFYAGLYTGGGLYDIEWGKSGVQGEFFIAAGLSGGFSHTINRSGSLRLDYSLGVGYFQTRYREYVPREYGAVLMGIRRGNYTWFGPTRAKISLVWLLNYKIKRGGAQ